MSEQLVEAGPTRGMDENEATIAKQIEQAIQDASRYSARGKQASEFRVGLSDLGYCSERTRRMLNQEMPEDTDLFKAWLGTVIGDGLEDAIVAAYPNVVKQAQVEVTLVGDRHTYTIPGHPDLIFPDEGLVLDGKSAHGLQLARRMGADQQKQFQRHGYGKGAWLAGYFGALPLEEVRVGNVWLDRSGNESNVHVQIEPFSDEVLADAGRWIDEVIYAYTTESVAQKEPPREVCAATCGFFSTCRAQDTDVSGLLEGWATIEAVQLYLEGRDMVRSGERYKSEAKTALDGIEGSTGTHTVRWISIDETVVPETKRKAHKRLDIRAVH